MAESTSAHTEAPGGAHKGAFPPFQAETYVSQLLWFALFFVLLYLLMSRLAVPRLRGIIEARQGRIAADLAEAKKLREESDAALAAYEKSLADARGHAQGIVNDMRDKLNAAMESSRKGLEEQLNAKLAEAERTISATKQAAMANVRGIATDAAHAIIERLIGTAPAVPTVEAAVSDVLMRPGDST
jgi:F-type H+-transporting ATPase subunit b